MFLKTLKLQNFRSYSRLGFEFKTPVTVLLGNNAQGKSNFLESIYFLSTTKSPKADRDEELIKSGEQVVRVQGTVDSGHETDDLEIVMVSDESGFNKRVKVNNLPRRVLDYIGHLSVVTFSPEDINLVTGSPSLRRWHIDLTLAQIDKQYKKCLTSYGEILVRKNRVLKMIREGEARVEELTFWTDQQLEYGKVVTDKRRELFQFLNSQERQFGDFSVVYDESKLNPERLREYQYREIAAAASLIGPHRDDFCFKLGDRNLAKFGSRGEHRTAVLDLKLSEASFIESKIGSRPILLLDDVFSELDKEHQKHVLKLVELQQTILAGVDLDEEIKSSLKSAAFFLVEEGRLTTI